MSAAFSAIMTTGALVLPDTSVGMMRAVDDAQAGDAVHAQLAHRPPLAASPAPILQVPLGWKIVRRCRGEVEQLVVASRPRRRAGISRCDVRPQRRASPRAAREPDAGDQRRAVVGSVDR